MTHSILVCQIKAVASHATKLADFAKNQLMRFQATSQESSLDKFPDCFFFHFMKSHFDYHMSQVSCYALVLMCKM